MLIVFFKKHIFSIALLLRRIFKRIKKKLIEFFFFISLTSLSFKFDIWNLIKRPMTSNPYYLTSRYRMRHTPVRRAKTGVISRRRRKDFQMGSDCGDSNRSATTTTDMFDLDKDFLEDFDFDGKIS